MPVRVCDSELRLMEFLILMAMADGQRRTAQEIVQKVNEMTDGALGISLRSVQSHCGLLWTVKPQEVAQERSNLARLQRSSRGRPSSEFVITPLGRSWLAANKPKWQALNSALAHLLKNSQAHKT